VTELCLHVVSVNLLGCNAKDMAVTLSGSMLPPRNLANAGRWSHKHLGTYATPDRQVLMYRLP
jgi:hypothetical protein